jgi:hypothetical protein
MSSPCPGHFDFLSAGEEFGADAAVPTIDSGDQSAVLPNKNSILNHDDTQSGALRDQPFCEAPV